MNTITIGHRKKKIAYKGTSLFYPEHRLTTVGVRITSRNLRCFLKISVSPQPHPPVHMPLKTMAFPSCLILNDNVNESTLQSKTATIIYDEGHCIWTAIYIFAISSGVSYELLLQEEME